MRRNPSPYRRLVLTALIVSLSEFALMLAMDGPSDNPAWVAGALDAALVGGLVLVCGYFAMARPLAHAEAAMLRHETWFRDYAASGSDWVWESSPDLRLTYVSSGFDHMVGLGRQGAIGKTLRECCASDDATSTDWESHARLQNDREPFRDLECPIRDADGELRWVRISGKPLFDDEGTFLGYRGAAADSTVEKHMRQELERTGNLLKGVLDTSLDSFLILSTIRDKAGAVADFQVTGINPRGEQMLKRPRPDILGKLLRLQLPGTVEDGLFEMAATTAETGQPFQRDHYYDQDGITGWFRISCVRLGDGLVISFADISERKEAERTVTDLLEELRRSNAELEQFAYVASHDLQEPLRMVASYLQLLDMRYRDKLDQNAQTFIGFAVDGAKRMQGLIHDLLTYSRVGSRGGKLLPVDCAIILQTAIANLQVSIAESVAVVTQGPMPQVTGEPAQLTSLFQNLIGNALKYRAPDRKPAIRVTAERQGSEWVFRIQDNGIGIAPEFFDRIFLIFQRLHTRDQYSGTGIGLAICKKIVERHSGRIWLESSPDQGTTFLFSLPAPIASAGEGI